jgi:hypothetical protein
MKLYENWKQILKEAWSIRFIALAGILSASETVLPMFQDILPRNTFATLSFLCISAAFVSRLVTQKGI